MKKIGITRLLAVALCMAALLFGMSVYADDCCQLKIESIEQSEDKIIVNLGIQTGVEEGTVTVWIDDCSGNGFAFSDAKNYTVSSVEHGEYSVISVEFDSSSFLKGRRYQVDAGQSGFCENGCYKYTNDSKNIVTEYGCPVYSVNNTLKKDFTRGETVALRYTASKSGFYQLFCDSWEIDINNNSSKWISGDIVYLEENQSAYFQVKMASWANGDSCTASFTVDMADCVTIQAVTDTPDDGDDVFLIGDGMYGMAVLEVPKSGIYDISGDVDFKLFSPELEELFNSDYGQVPLCRGTYYCFVDMWGEDTATVKYNCPEELVFDEEYIVNSEEPKYLYFELNEPAAIYKTDTTYDVSSVSIFSSDAEPIDLTYDSPVVLFAGEYMLSYCTDYGETYEIFSKEDVPVTIIGDEIEYYVDNRDSYNKHAVLQAPQTAEYVFYSSDWYTIPTEDKEIDVYGYSYITLNKDEQVYVRNYGWDDSDMTAEVFEIEYTPLMLGEALEIDEIYGSVGMSFTAPEQGNYFFEFDMSYLDKIKIFTGDEVIFESYVDSDSYSTDEVITLDKNETVYIDVFSSEGYGSVKVFEAITDGIVVDFSECDDLIYECVFKPSQAKYYNFAVRKLEGDGIVSVYVPMETDEWWYDLYNAGESYTSMLYGKPEHPLYITIFAENDTEAVVELTVEVVCDKSVADASSITITDESCHSVIAPLSGVYELCAKGVKNEEADFDMYTEMVINLEKIGGTSFWIGEGESYSDYIYAFAGEEILVYASWFECDVEMSLKPVEAIPLNLEDGEFAIKPGIYSIHIPQDGEYVFESFDDSYFRMCNADVWMDANEEESFVREFKQGNLYIFYSVNEEDANDSVAKFALTEQAKYTALELTYQINDKDEYSYSYKIIGDIPDGAVLCAVLYDTGKFVEAEIIKCPGKNGDIMFDSTVYGYHECKLFLLDEDFTPVCSEVVCD